MKALVIGGGVAGPATAMALAMAGIDSEVHEAEPLGQDDTTGSFLTLQTNGIDALRAIEADHAVVDQGMATPYMRIHDHRGRQLGLVPCGAPLPDGTQARTMMRAALYSSLRDEAARRGIPVHHDHRLLSLEQDAAGVTATFTDGTTASGDLLVGCDGIRSTVRAAIDPTAPPARYVPLLNLGGVAIGAEVETAAGELAMAFGRRAFVLWLGGPADQVWWGVNLPHQHEPRPGELRSVPDGEWRSRLQEAFDGGSLPVSALVAATPAELVAWPTHDLPRVERWHAGRVVLAGDAAHATSPSSGQGAAMALEDAVQLARCLRDVTPLPAAFAAYERLRRGRVERIVRQGARTSSTKAAGPVGRTIRNLGMRLMLPDEPRPPGRSLRWVTDHHIEFATPVAT